MRGRAFLTAGALAFAGFVVFAQQAEPPVSDGDKQSVEKSWWLPYDMPTGVAQEFHLTFTRDRTARGQDLDASEQMDFTVEVLPVKNGPGCIARLRSPGWEHDSAYHMELYLNTLAFVNPEGLRLSDKHVVLFNIAFLRGPWSVGDQFTVISSFPVASAAHFDVISASPERVHLTCEFGTHLDAEFSGTGDLWMENDKRGITAVRATWKWKSKHAREEGELRISRTRITKLEKPAADGVADSKEK